MNIKRLASRILWKLFPQYMDARRQRIEYAAIHAEHEKQLEAIQERVHFTQEQWEQEIKERYKELFGSEPDLTNPKRYTEKIQWRKLYEHDPRMSVLSDKYAVRDWVKERIGEEYLIPLLGVWDRAEDIDFDKLPESFVLKTNNASGKNIIVTDKRAINISIIKETLDYWLRFPFWADSGELHYRAIEPHIIAEEYIQCKDLNDLPDYKFFCYSGQVSCSYHIKGRFKGKTDESLGIYDREYNLMPYYRADFPKETIAESMPDNYSLMVALAEKLSEGFSHVRVDLYNVNGKVYFGEMTFTTGSGFFQYEPDSFDYLQGELWHLGGDCREAQET